MCDCIDTVVFNEMIEAFPRHSWPDCDVEVLRMIIQNFGHFLRQVDANSAKLSRRSPLQSSSGSVRNDRNRFQVTKFANLEMFKLKQSLQILKCSNTIPFEQQIEITNG